MANLCDHVDLAIAPGAVSTHYEVTAQIEGNLVGYATFKPGRNDYVRGYRIGNYSVFPPHQRQGIGLTMIAFFQKETGHLVIPSQLFGAQGKLTHQGLLAAIKRLRRDVPGWLPLNWENLLEEPRL